MIKILQMGRSVSGATRVREWLKRAVNAKTVEIRKFYSSEELFDIYKNDNLIKDTISEEKDIIYYLRQFVRNMNEVIRSSQFSQVKSRFTKHVGYEYIFLHQSACHTDINLLRLSKRRSARKICRTSRAPVCSAVKYSKDTETTAKYTETPSQTPSVSPTVSSSSDKYTINQVPTSQSVSPSVGSTTTTAPVINVPSQVPTTSQSVSLSVGSTTTTNVPTQAQFE